MPHKDRDARNAYARQWRKANPEKVREANQKWQKQNPHKPMEYYRRWTLTQYRDKMWPANTIKSHKKRGYIITVDRETVAQLAVTTDNCFYCGCLLDWRPLQGKGKINGPTLDRIDNEKILTSDNIRIICRKCNTTKNDRTHEEFVDFCHQVVLRHKTGS